MIEPKQYFLDSLEKYQHFSTGLMFAVAAAAVQSAKHESAGMLQTSFELVAWGLLIFAALLGVFTALRITRYMRTADALALLVDEHNDSIKDAVGTFYELEGPDGTRKNVNKDEYIQDLRKQHDVSVKQIRAAFESIHRWNKTQLWIFAFGLIVLAAARAMPFFGHKTSQSVVVSISK